MVYMDSNWITIECLHLLQENTLVNIQIFFEILSMMNEFSLLQMRFSSFGSLLLEFTKTNISVACDCPFHLSTTFCGISPYVAICIGYKTVNTPHLKGYLSSCFTAAKMCRFACSKPCNTACESQKTQNRSNCAGNSDGIAKSIWPHTCRVWQAKNKEGGHPKWVMSVFMHFQRYVINNYTQYFSS